MARQKAAPSRCGTAMETDMFANTLPRTAPLLAALAIASLASWAPPSSGDAGTVPDDGIVENKSAYPIGETVNRITDDIAEKGIVLFDIIDQAKLAKNAGVDLRPSKLIVFGNPPLGTLFLTAKAESGLDWPVRLLVFEDADGQVWTAYTDFDWIARRHGIENREQEFRKASEVIASIVASVGR
jgi:uncharacterized protein (DUF302 family)